MGFAAFVFRMTEGPVPLWNRPLFWLEVESYAMRVVLRRFRESFLFSKKRTSLRGRLIPSLADGGKAAAAAGSRLVSIVVAGAALDAEGELPD